PSITRAARAAGMTRESAYRLRDRDRDSGGLFASAWDKLLEQHCLARRARPHRFLHVRDFPPVPPRTHAKGHNVSHPPVHSTPQSRS
ncbi:MAG: hypothetical protein ABIO80_00080, partial [Sphingomicrobium sp.]